MQVKRKKVEERKKDEERKERREEDKVSRKLRLGNYPNFSLLLVVFLGLSWV